MDPSQRVPLGRTSIQVSRLGLGTVAVGNHFGGVDAAQAEALIRRSFELGVRYFDTAPVYGFGVAESRLGEILPSLPRSEFTVSTKVGRLLQPMSVVGKTSRILREAVSMRGQGVRFIAYKAQRVLQRATRGTDSGVRLGYPFDRGAQALTEVWDFSYDGVMRSVEGSLRRLKLDRVDMLMLHDPDDHYAEAISGAYRALEKLRGEGTVAAIGVGMRHAPMLARFAREGDFDCFLAAGVYTLLDQSALDELLPLCAEKRIPVVIGGVYNSGILVDPKPGAFFDYEPASKQWLDRAQRIKAVCDRYDVPLRAAAIQFPFGHSAVASVLTGAASAAELEENIGFLETPIPPALWEELRKEGLLSEAAALPAAAAG